MTTISVRRCDDINTYMREYMAAYRAKGGGLRGRPRRPRGHYTPPVIRPMQEQRDGHCVFCGLLALGDVCGFCVQEIAA